MSAPSHNLACGPPLDLKASPGLLNLTNLLGALDTFDLGASSDEEGKEKAEEVEKRKKKGKGKGAKDEEVPSKAPAPLQRANSLEELVLKVGVSEDGMWNGRIIVKRAKRLGQEPAWPSQRYLCALLLGGDSDPQIGSPGCPGCPCG